MKGIQKDHSW